MLTQAHQIALDMVDRLQDERDALHAQIAQLEAEVARSRSAEEQFQKDFRGAKPNTFSEPSTLVNRLRGKYAIGPVLPNGEPQFGWKIHDGLCPIHQEAANRIETLEADAKRLNWLERMGFSTHRNSRREGPIGDPGVHAWRDSEQWGWTAAWISSEFDSCREAIDAAMRGQNESLEPAHE